MRLLNCNLSEISMTKGKAAPGPMGRCGNAGAMPRGGGGGACWGRSPRSTGEGPCAGGAGP